MSSEVVKMDIEKEILAEIERFEQCGTHLDAGSFISNLKEMLSSEVVKMDIKKEKKAIKNLKAHLMDEWELTEEQKDAFDDLVFRVLAVGKEEAEAQAVPEGFVLVPTKNTKYFSHDGENYEVHDTLAEAKYEAECAIESFRERLADQVCNPPEDGNFQQVGYGIVLAEAGYSVDHIVTQEDIDNGEYRCDVGTEIMSLFLTKAQEQKATALKVDWTSDCFNCGYHEAIIYSTASEATSKGWFHDGDKAQCCKCGHEGEMDTRGGDSDICWYENEALGPANG